MIAHGLIVLILAACASPGAQTPPGATSPESQVRTLYGERRYADVIRLPPAAGDSADFYYYRGMAFAKLKRWTEAWNTLRQGELKDPHDGRFAVELAGADFELRHYRRAKSELHRALRANPKDTYANDFLASLYYLDGNLAAALKYWNRAGKPRVNQIQTDPQPELKPVLFERTLAFSRGDILTLPEYRATQQRIQGLGVFPQFRLELVPNPDQEYSVKIHPLEVNGWGDSAAEGLISLLRGVPYETLYPEVFNFHHSAVNLVSMLRWDPNKQRVFAALAGPVAGSARTRYQLYLDSRKENWDISHTFFAAASPVTDLRLNKIEGGAEIMTLVDPRLALRGGVDLSGRSFANFNTHQSGAAAFFANGFALTAESSARYRLADFPDHRFKLDSTGSIQAGHDFARTLDNFAQAEGGLAADWLPQASTDDYEMTAQVRAGHTFGMVPFDNLFMLGLERDNDLWLQGQVGTANGRKGSAPLGRDYTLTNWGDDKIIFQNGICRVRLGPFLDSGRITDPSNDFGSGRWMWDAGLELKIRVLGGTEVALFFGKDLLTGRTSFYATTLGFPNGPFPPGPAPFRGY